MSDFTAKGKDGYEILTKCKVLVDEENAVELKQLITSFLDEAKPDENDGEVSLFKSNLEIFSPHVIRRLINLKTSVNKLTKKVKAVRKPDEPQTPTITKSVSNEPPADTSAPRYQRSSSVRRLDPEAAQTFKALCEDEPNKPSQHIDMPLLKRLRKYQLLGGFHRTPEGKLVPGVCPREEGRIAAVGAGEE